MLLAVTWLAGCVSQDYYRAIGQSAAAGAMQGVRNGIPGIQEPLRQTLHGALVDDPVLKDAARDMTRSAVEVLEARLGSPEIRRQVDALVAQAMESLQRDGDETVRRLIKAAGGTLEAELRRVATASVLAALRKMTPIRLIQLVDANDVNPDGSLDFTAPFDRPYDWTVSKDPKLRARLFSFFATDEGLREIRTYADGIGPWKRYIVSAAAVDLNGDGKIGDENGDGKVDEADRKLLPANDLIGRAHRLGLLVHTWTFRNEQKRLPSDYQGNPVNEYLQLYALGIDGVFSDFADAAVSARVLHRLATDPEFGPCFTGDTNRQGHGACRGSDD